MAAFWDMAPCSPVVDRRFRGATASIIKAINDGGGRTNLWNVGLLLRDYTASYPTRLPSSYGNMIYEWWVKYLEGIHGGLYKLPSENLPTQTEGIAKTS
jgi:hypothetical protein